MAVMLRVKGTITSPERTAEGFVENRDAHVQNGCTVHLFHRICCFLTMRLGRISLTTLSTKAFDIGSPSWRRRA